MDKKTFAILILVSSLIASSALVSSQGLTVICEAGGPYVRAATKIVRGEVLEGSKGVSATVSVNITGTSYSSETTSNNQGKYKVKFLDTLEVGNYTANITATNGTNSGTCTDDFQVRITELSPNCVSKTINITGIAILRSTGAALPSGRLTGSVVDENIRNDTTITDGQFSVVLSGCIKPSQRYLVQLHVVDSSGTKENWSQIIFAGA